MLKIFQVNCFVNQKCNISYFSTDGFRSGAAGVSPLVFELLRILRASLTFLGTEVGGCGGAEVGIDAGGGPEKKKENCLERSVFKIIFVKLPSSIIFLQLAASCMTGLFKSLF